MKKIAITYLTTLLMASTSLAQGVLTLKEAVQQGLEKGYSVRLSKNDLQVATNNNTYGNAGFFPKIDASIGANTSAIDNIVKELDGSETNTSNNSFNTSTGISLSWTLFDGMRMFVTKDKLDLLQQIGETNLRVDLENSAALIISTYNAIVQQKKLISVFEEALTISKRRVEIAQKAKTIGIGSDVVQLKAEVDYQTDSSNLVSQRLLLSNLKAELNSQIGNDPRSNFEVEPLDFSASGIVLDEILGKALEQNPSLIASRQIQMVSELEIKNARAAQLPSINLSSNYTFNHNNYRKGVRDMSQSYGPFVGVTAGITLFNGFNAKRNVKNARLQFENAQITTEQQEQQLKTAIIKTYNAYATNRSLVNLEQKSLALAQKNLDIALKAYAQGSISDVEMRETQRNFIDVSYRLVTAQVNLKNTEIELKRISGTLLIQ